ncbi:hypothetical protein Peur_044075 [Populus x canadensis]
MFVSLHLRSYVQGQFSRFLLNRSVNQVQALRSLEFYICYYGWGDNKLRQNTCKTNDVYNTSYFIVAVIPYWSRLLQARLENEHLHNVGKYRAFKAVPLPFEYSMRQEKHELVIASEQNA